MKLFGQAARATEQAVVEACQVTVLFADLEGFSAMAERLPPHEVVAVLNESFTVMADEVFREGGSVDKYIGDAMMVVWATSDPAAADEAARAAARAALRMVAALEALQVERLNQGKRPVKVRIGISSGEAIIGEIGCPARRDRTVIGDPVNLACRLEELNKTFHTDILVSGATRGRLAAGFEVRDLGQVAIKGRRESVAVFALVGSTART
ncbi:MAG: adenylate/guanylate cyclase domain-containing protein [Candidatus Sericytochromatia bacterium]|nr:adenylate/guanylate cyclase domain-containing protein [Candidatus Tanganyikabacteria bacterium]